MSSFLNLTSNLLYRHLYHSGIAHEPICRDLNSMQSYAVYLFTMNII